MARPSPRIIALFIGIGAIAWIAAFAVDRVVAGALALPENARLETPGIADVAPDDGGPDEPASGFSPRRPRPGKSEFVRPIVERSLFDSAKVGQQGGSGESDGPVGLSDLDAVLLATVVANTPEYSSALIQAGKGDSAETRGYGVGDSLMGEGTVVEIMQRKVVIERPDGSREFIQMDGKAEVRRPASGMPKPGEEGEGDGVVQKVGDNKYVVDADFVEKALQNPEKLASQVRVAPHKGADGNVDGYRLSGIRRNSFFKQLGVKNGDIVHSVNGHELTSMSNAMSAFESLQSEKAFTFELTRRNQRETYEYEIR